MKPKKAYIPDPAINGKTIIKPVSTSPEKTPNAKKTIPIIKQIKENR